MAINVSFCDKVRNFRLSGAKSGPMLLLHISDIHFRAPDCVNPALDADRPFRTRLVQDARARSDALGPMGVFLIGGDIEYKGDPQEYQAAFTWFNELAEACRCPLERVFVIPGNHDVDRGVITRSPATRNAQQAIKTAAAHRRERELENSVQRSRHGPSIAHTSRRVQRLRQALQLPSLFARAPLLEAGPPA